MVNFHNYILSKFSVSSRHIYYINTDNRDTSSREIMAAKEDEPDNRSEQPPVPSLTGDRRLDKALEKLRRTLEAKKEKEAATPEPRKSCPLTRLV
jgi:hypothetical protein